MKVLHNSFSVYWKRHHGGRLAFQADVGKEGPTDTARDAVVRFKSLFPGDIVVAVKDQSGRYQAYKQ